MDGIDAGFAGLGGAGRRPCVPDGLLQSLIVDGLIAGVGSVIIFLPQIVILFAFIILLEDFGYMARAAFLMDRIMGGAGLHGRAFIPLLSSFACAIPGVMAARVIDSKRDRLTTIMVAPADDLFGADPGLHPDHRAPSFPNETVWGFANLQGLVMFGLYAAGIVSALTVSFVIRRVFWRGAVEPFMMELPAYKLPDAKTVLINLWLRAQIFLTRAGRIILPLMIAGLGRFDLPLSARRRDRAGHRLQLRRHDRPGAGADLRAHRLQLADGHRPGPRHGRARSGRGGAGHGLCRRRRRRRVGSALAATAGRPMVAGDGPGLPGLVRLRAAVRADPGRGQARDQLLELDDGHDRLHVRPGLSGARSSTYRVAVALGGGGPVAG